MFKANGDVLIYGRMCIWKRAISRTCPSACRIYRLPLVTCSLMFEMSPLTGTFEVCAGDLLPIYRWNSLRSIIRFLNFLLKREFLKTWWSENLWKINNWQQKFLFIFALKDVELFCAFAASSAACRYRTSRSPILPRMTLLKWNLRNIFRILPFFDNRCPIKNADNDTCACFCHNIYENMIKYSLGDLKSLSLGTHKTPTVRKNEWKQEAFDSIWILKILNAKQSIPPKQLIDDRTNAGNVTIGVHLRVQKNINSIETLVQWQLAQHTLNT